MIEGIKNRPREVNVTAENAADFAAIESCLINTETGKIDHNHEGEGSGHQ